MTRYYTINDWVNDVFKTIDGYVGSTGSSSLTRRIQPGQTHYDPFNQTPYTKVSGFPPINVEINEETKAFRVSFALAGLWKDQVKLSFDDGYLILEIKDSEKAPDNWKTIHQGIKKSVACTKKYQFPTDKYNTAKTVAVWNNGILQVTVPLKEERKPQEIAIK